MGKALSRILLGYGEEHLHLSPSFSAVALMLIMLPSCFFIEICVATLCFQTKKDKEDNNVSSATNLDVPLFFMQ